MCRLQKLSAPEVRPFAYSARLPGNFCAASWHYPCCFVAFSVLFLFNILAIYDISVLIPLIFLFYHRVVLIAILFQLRDRFGFVAGFPVQRMIVYMYSNSMRFTFVLIVQ